MEEKNNLTQIDKKPTQKCVGFKRKIGHTNYEVEAFYSGETGETLKAKIKRILREEVKK